MYVLYHSKLLMVFFCLFEGNLLHSDSYKVSIFPHFIKTSYLKYLNSLLTFGLCVLGDILDNES